MAANIIGPIAHEFFEHIVLLREQRSRRFLEIGKVTRDRTHELEGRLARQARLFPFGILLPRLVHETTERRRRAAWLVFEPFPMTWKERNLPRHHAELWTTWSRFRKIRRDSRDHLTRRTPEVEVHLAACTIFEDENALVRRPVEPLFGGEKHVLERTGGNASPSAKRRKCSAILHCQIITRVQSSVNYCRVNSLSAQTNWRVGKGTRGRWRMESRRDGVTDVLPRDVLPTFHLAAPTFFAMPFLVPTMPFRLRPSLVVLLFTLLRVREARADDDADRLFREGRALMLQGNFADACPKIGDSQKREPRVGTLLNLAACHEQLGLLGTAWVEFETALTTARSEGQPDRERFALERIHALESRVPWLTLAVTATHPESVVVTLDGTTLDRAAWDKAMPVDPGMHVVRANAAQGAPFETRFEIREAERRTISILASSPSAAVETPGPSDPTPSNFVPAYASVAPPLATNYNRLYATTHFGFNLLYGRAGELDGGLQLGTVNLIVGKDGIATGNMSGVQLAPLFGLNYASGHAAGIQGAFFGNGAGKGIEGGQVSFGANVSAGDVDGAQLAFGSNIATGSVRGVQIAGINVAGNVDGAQVGIVNVAKKVRGLTFGLVNVADDIDGVAIGLANVTKSGGVHPVAWGSSATYANAGIKFATKHTYTIIAGHYTHDTGHGLNFNSRDFVGGGFFIGGHIPVGKAFADIDLGFSGLAAPTASEAVLNSGATRRYHEVILEPRLRVLGGYTLAPHFSLFGGAGCVVRARLVKDHEEAFVRAMPELVGGIQF